MIDLSSVVASVKKRTPDGVKTFYYSIVARPPRLRNVQRFLDPLKGKRGIEIGGPSRLFRGKLPVYDVVGELDGVNFAHDTMWEGEIQGGRTFRYGQDRCGTQFVMEATDLSAIPSRRYEVLLSSNCLEHVANPLKALKEWQRVVVPGGSLLLAVPRKKGNFDHRRPITPFAHLLEDFHNDTSEHDLTHLDEILALHDLERDQLAGSIDAFKARSLENFQHRGLHHHVFDLALVEQMFDFLGIRLVHSGSTPMDHVALGTVG